MAEIYQQLAVRGHYLYRCAACGKSWQRSFKRNTLIRADVEDREAAVKKRLAQTAPTSPPSRHCQHCDATSNEYIAARQKRLDPWPATLGILAMVIFIMLAHESPKLVNYFLCSAAAAGIAIAMLVAFIWIEIRFGFARRQTGLLEPAKANRAISSPLHRSRWPIYAMLVVSTVFLISHPVSRWTLRAPLNDNCDPFVIAPGDTVRIYMDNSLSSLDGYWTAEARLTVNNAFDYDPPLEFAISTQPHQETDFVRVPDEARSQRPRVYADVTLPDDSALAGASIDLAIDMQVVYIKTVGRHQFRFETETLSQERAIQVATVEQARLDQTMYDLCYSLGFCFAVVASAWALGRNWRIQKSAPRPDVVIDEIDVSEEWEKTR